MAYSGKGLGNTHFAGAFTHDEIFSLDLATAKIKIIAPDDQGRIVFRLWPVSAGDHFLFAEWRLRNGSGDVLQLPRITDGKSPPVDWYMPDEGGAGSARYAHTHAGFIRGFDEIGSDKQFARAEVWSTPWSPDPAQLQPRKLGDIVSAHDRIGITNSTGAIGGHGFYLLNDPFWDDVLGYSLWNLETGDNWHYDTPLPAPMKFAVGITRTHAWLNLKSGLTYIVERTELPK